MTHYDTLGVSKDSDSQTIKQAFRKKARKAHPDKGGKTEDMAKLNQAYSVLSDESRKQEYDRTGSDTPQATADGEATGVIMQIFSKALETGQPAPLRFTFNTIDHSMQGIDGQLAQARSKLAQLKKHRGVVKSDSDVNLFQSLVDQQIEQVNQSLGNLGKQKNTFARAKELLAGYSEDAPPPQPQYTSTSSTMFYTR